MHWNIFWQSLEVSPPPSTMKLVLLECPLPGWEHHHTEFLGPHIMCVLGGFAALTPAPTASVSFVTLDQKLSTSSTGNRMGTGAECKTYFEEVLETDAEGIFGNSFTKLKKKGISLNDWKWICHICKEWIVGYLSLKIAKEALQSETFQYATSCPKSWIHNCLSC